jgi:hypothetical protein
MMLALKMGRTLEELGRSMSSNEFSLWMELYRENMWGEQFAYERAGIVASTIANCAGMTRAKGAEPAAPADFMPYKPKAAREEDAEPDPMAFVQQAQQRR